VHCFREDASVLYLSAAFFGIAIKVYVQVLGMHPA
jgi:hypothetical protein